MDRMNSLFEQYKKCTNDLCDRKTRTSAAYCCYGCSKAHDGLYEIHESGILGHSDLCNEKHRERGPVNPMTLPYKES